MRMHCQQFLSANAWILWSSEYKPMRFLHAVNPSLISLANLFDHALKVSYPCICNKFDNVAI